MTPDVVDFSWLRLLMAFAVTLGLLAALGFVLKYVGTRGLGLSNRSGRAKRLSVVETLVLDTKRRCVIVRCDEKEHLLLLNSEGDIVIETNLAPKVP